MENPLVAAADAAPTTPALVVDVETLDRNIARMAEAASAAGLALRPHAKTHKCPQIAERQIAAGAVGLTVATIGEAEAFAAGGVTDLFIAYPLWLDDDKRERLTKLAASVSCVRVGVESIENARRIASAVAAGTGE